MRQEWKTILNEEQVKIVYRVLSKQNAVKDSHGDDFGRYKVVTTYLCIWKSAIYSGKIRIRMYEKTENEKAYFIENKYKNGNLKFKSRIRITPQQFYEISKMNDAQLLQVLCSIVQHIFPTDSHIRFITLEDKITLTYLRTAYILKIDDSEMRITIDRDLKTILPDKREIRVSSIDKKEHLLEIKGANIAPFFEIPEIVSSNFMEKSIKFSKYKKAKNTQELERVYVECDN